MTPHLYNTDVITPALALLGPEYDSPRARAMLIAIALQESRLIHRRQIRGPARGLHQFETGGVRAVLTHRVVKDAAQDVLQALGLAPVSPDDPAAVAALHAQFEHSDLLDCAFARLLLWADPRPLPRIGQYDFSWTVYIFGWRPGKPHRHTWDDFYDDAWAAVS